MTRLLHASLSKRASLVCPLLLPLSLRLRGKSTYRYTKSVGNDGPFYQRYIVHTQTLLEMDMIAEQVGLIELMETG